MRWKLALASLVAAHCGIASATITDVTFRGTIDVGAGLSPVGSPIEGHFIYDDDQAAASYPGLSGQLDLKINHNDVYDGILPFGYEPGIGLIYAGRNDSLPTVFFSIADAHASSHDLPSYEDLIGDAGNLTFYDFEHVGGLDGITGTITVGAVPEPAIWSMMIVGFGTLGSALRRRMPGEQRRLGAA